MHRGLACLLALAIVFPLGALAVEPADRAQMQGLVDRQIEAFRADDADRAYALASPAIRSMFGSAERFMAMVKGGYRPVYRPRRYEFGESRDGQAGPELFVRLDDSEGAGWTAIYSFEKQPDGGWAISGCRLVKAPDQTV